MKIERSIFSLIREGVVSIENLAPTMPDTRHLKPQFSDNMLSDKTR
jgi:hypothetical protein